MSDNGAGGKGGRGTVTGGKGSLWAGGIRVPLIIRGPGVKASAICHTRVVGHDLFPTFCELAGVPQPLPKGVEGGSIASLFAEGTGAVKRPREELVFHFPHYQSDTPHSAIFLGDFKLIKFYETGNVQLFNIAKDISESRDLTKAMPDKVADLSDRLDAYLKAVNAQLPVPNPKHDPNKTYEKKGGNKKRGGKSGGGRRRDQQKTRGQRKGRRSASNAE